MEEKITLLSKDDAMRSEPLRKYGRAAYVTDLFILQKGFVYGRLGIYWTKTACPDFSGSVYIVDYDHTINGSYNARGSEGVRPVLRIPNIDDFNSSIRNVNGIEEVEYGEYPQSAVDKKIKKRLEKLYICDKLQKTNKKYTFMLNLSENSFYEYEFQEYEYKGDKYIRVDTLDRAEKLSLDDLKHDEDVYWVKVEPIKWLVDRKNKMFISKYLLVNMPFEYGISSPFGGGNDYETSDIKKFLEQYFIKEINLTKPTKEENKIDIDKINELKHLVDSVYKNDEKPKVKKL